MTNLLLAYCLPIGSLLAHQVILAVVGVLTVTAGSVDESRVLGEVGHWWREVGGVGWGRGGWEWGVSVRVCECVSV